MVIGGAQIYAEVLPKVQKIYLTQVHASIEGDAWFPELEDTWQELSRQDFKAEGDSLLDYSFVVCGRVV
jgi:dihydrofolate reductase